MGQIPPLLLLAIATGVASAPWVGGGNAALDIAAGLLPAVVIHYWALRRASVLPVIAVLFSGLCVDVLSGGPFGFWTSVYSFSWVIGLVQRRWATVFWKPGRWAMFGVAVVILAGGISADGAVLGGDIAPAGVLLEASIWLIAGYPLLAAILRIGDGTREGRPLESD